MLFSSAALVQMLHESAEIPDVSVEVAPLHDGGLGCWGHADGACGLLAFLQALRISDWWLYTRKQ